MAAKQQVSVNAPKKNGTVVAACVCTHTFQDKQYGAGRRLHNICGKGTKRRCTVCSKEAVL